MKKQNTALKRILLEIKQETGMTQDQIAKQIGTGRTYLSDVANGRAILTNELRDKLLALLPYDKSRFDIQEDSAGIPLIPIEAIAGYGKLAYDDLPVESFYQVGVFKNVDFLMRISGDSMAPIYCGGDLVACRIVKETLFFQWGHVYVINTRSQGVVIKRVQRSDAEGNITCVSENPKYDEFDVPVSDISNIALVVGAITLS